MVKMKRIKSLLIDIIISLFGTIIAVVAFTLRLYGNIEEITLNAFIGFFILIFGLVKISEIIFIKHQTIGEKYIGLTHIDKNNQNSLKRRVWRDFILLFFLLGSYLTGTIAGYIITAILLIPSGKNKHNELALMIDSLVGVVYLREVREDSRSS
jgi:hypothetical protein